MNSSPKQVVVCGSFDDLRSTHIRFLEEAAKLGDLTVLLWNDEAVRRLSGTPVKFPEAERFYVLQSIRFVSQVTLADAPNDSHILPTLTGAKPHTWVIDSTQEHPAKRQFCAAQGIELRTLSDVDLHGFPEPPASPPTPGRKKIIVTGCYDWFHSGHVRFFEEVSTYGDLYVCAGNDASVRYLKGKDHPMHSQDERRYVVGAVRFVKQALVTSGTGWLDAEPEIERLKPDIYAVNEDGDKGGKREFCEKRGIEYLVLNVHLRRACQREPARVYVGSNEILFTMKANVFFFVLLVPVLWGITSFAHFHFPGDEYFLWLISSMAGGWILFFIPNTGDIHQWWIRFGVAGAGTLTMAAIGFLLCWLRIRKWIWTAFWVLGMAGWLKYALAQYPDMERALARNGSWWAYLLSAALMASYTATMLTIVGASAKMIWRKFTKRKSCASPEA